MPLLVVAAVVARYEPPPMRLGRDRLPLAVLAPASAGHSLGGRADAAAQAAVVAAPASRAGIARYPFQLGSAIDPGGDPEAAEPPYRTASRRGYWLAVSRLSRSVPGRP
jgi:hypothetical protein